MCRAIDGSHIPIKPAENHTDYYNRKDGILSLYKLLLIMSILSEIFVLAGLAVYMMQEYMGTVSCIRKLLMVKF